MKIINMLATAGAMLAIIGTANAVGPQPLEMIKTIPQAATLEYRIGGRVIQSLDIAPGTYQISIKQIH